MNTDSDYPLIDRYLDGIATEKESAALAEAIDADPDALAALCEAGDIEASLRRHLATPEQLQIMAPRMVPVWHWRRAGRWIAAGAAAAALVVTAAGIFWPAKSGGFGRETSVPPQMVAEPKPQPPAIPPCAVDLRRAGQMSDIISNVLLRAEHKPEPEVQAFLKDAEKRYATGDDLLKAAAAHFKIDQKRLASLVEHWRHINCKHAAIPGYAVPDHPAPGTGRKAPMGGTLSPPVPVSAFAADVTLHVVLHELGHAVIREFDLMVLGNEETMADGFATHLLTEHFPEHAVRVISARVRSLMIEANEVPRDQWTVRGEHDNDARRASQIAALAIAADKEKYAGVAEIAGMSERDMDNACDYGSDIHRAWRRTLSPLMMPAGKVSKEARFRADASTRAFVDAGKPSLASTIQSALQRIDWHSQVTVDFVGGSGGAAWNRSKRTVTVNSEYLERFIAQGVKAETQAAPRDPDRR